MATSSPLTLPGRCWELNPGLLRECGLVGDFEIETHAMAEMQCDKELGIQFAKEHGLAPDEIVALMAALKARRRAVWGRYDKD